VGYNNTFQRLFYVDCPQAVATLNITADNLFYAYLNGAYIGTGSNWTISYVFYVNVKCGLNNLTVLVINHDAGSPAALIYTLVQNQQQVILANSDQYTTIIHPTGLTTAI